MFISKHNNTGLRIDSHSRSNGNHIRLEVQGKEKLHLDLYELPEEVTDKLLAVFGDEATTDFDKQRAA